jgi:hypothetical protein
MKKVLAIAVVMLAVKLTAIAQPPPPPSNPGGAGGGAAAAPLDGGITLLLAAGAGLGAKYRMNRKQATPAE